MVKVVKFHVYLGSVILDINVTLLHMPGKNLGI